MSTVNLREEIFSAFAVESVTKRYRLGEVEVTDLREALGTKGHVFVVRGDLALADQLPCPELASPKMWVYEELVRSERIQEALKSYPDYRLFDGVGFFGLEALGFHATRLGRGALAVMAREFIPDPALFKRWNIEVINGDGLAEEGYIKKQAEILASRKDLIPFHQALYGAKALAPVGNAVADIIADRCHLDFTFWCVAGGSNLYGIGGKIKQHFPHVKTVVVEPEMQMTIGPDVDPHDSVEVRRYVKSRLKGSLLTDWDQTSSGLFPLHVASPNRYLLHLWNFTGDMGFDELMPVRVDSSVATQHLLKEVNQEWDWTKTTALALTPAIEEARKGSNVLVVSYGKNREHQYKHVRVAVP
ncbi:hypothetical protein HQ584_11885 [Patescibacteria group bacterium]|nr:hypothetical protein [Patescibacteria group bacterium]